MKSSPKRQKFCGLDPTTTSTLVPSGKSVLPSLRVVMHACLGVSGAFAPEPFLLGPANRRRRRPLGSARASWPLALALALTSPSLSVLMAHLPVPLRADGSPSPRFLWFFLDFSLCRVASLPVLPGCVSPPVSAPHPLAHLSLHGVLGPLAIVQQQPVLWTAAR